MTLDISKITLPPHTSDAASKVVKDMLESQRALAKALAPQLDATRQIDALSEIAKTARNALRHESPFSKLVREVTDRQAMLRDIALPLTQLRESYRLSDEIVKSLAASGNIAGVKDEFLRLSHSITGSEVIGKQLAEFSAFNLQRLTGADDSFQTILKTFKQNSDFSRYLEEISSGRGLAKAFQFPVIDESAATAVAKIWGREGVERQLRALGGDFSNLLNEGFNIDLKGATPSPLKVEPKLQIDFWTFVSIVMTILMFLYQLRDSAEMESRIAGEVRKSNEQLVKRTERLEELLGKFIEKFESVGQSGIKFIVRSRVALIRMSPNAGSVVIAEVFPNQVVELVGENGKWINVEYFDWLNQEVRSGWVLKKYLVRIPNRHLLPGEGIKGE